MTDQLVLRRFVEADLDLLLSLDRDPDVMRYVNGAQPISEETARAQLLPTFINERSLGFWVICKDGRDLGWVSLREYAPGSAELGYRLLPSAWGRGVARTAAREAIRRGAEAGFQRVTATAYEENLASFRVMQHCGMAYSHRFSVRRGESGAADHLPATCVPDEDAWPLDDLVYALELPH